MNDLLKFITCGSVDDGKSTLIGHMLYDSKMLFTDQEKALVLDSRVGSNDGEIDYSLLLDGLMAEREQGITIDVAYRYFKSEKRSFIVADTPGHEEYTRNMAVGASFADLSIILIDASKGILIQTKRHARICAMMGIRHFVFALNKMDLVDYDEKVYSRISDGINEFMSEFQYSSIAIIPVSATVGDNITEKSPNMTWYSGSTLLSYLEDVDVSAQADDSGFCMPVQRVCRPNRSFRGFQGQISCGTVHVGDSITVHPSGETAKVSEIYQTNKNVYECSAGNAVTICLDSEIDISRGDALTRDCNLHESARFIATILWMDDDTLHIGKNFWLKTGTKMIPASIVRIVHKIDINTGNEIAADTINKNDIFVCEISTSEKIAFNLFSRDRAMGSLILIDRVSHMTSACGVIEESISKDANIFWQNTDITKEFRENSLGQKARTIWLTGFSGSGKSTIANALEIRLCSEGKHTMILDGDNIRMGLSNDLGFSFADRFENLRRVAEAAKLLNEAGIIVITAFISPLEDMRQMVRRIIGEDFVEVFVDTPLEECIKRDVKGLYKKAASGEIKDFTGIGSGFEIPKNADITVNTPQYSPEECTEIILQYLKRND